MNAPLFSARPRRENGFTLLEMMAAMTITVILVLLLTSALNQTSRAWLQGEKMADTFGQARMGLAYFANEVSTAVVGHNGEYGFQGNSNILAFAAADYEDKTKVDQKELVYALEGMNAPYSLKRRLIHFQELGVGDTPNPNVGYNIPADPNPPFRSRSWGEMTVLGGKTNAYRSIFQNWARWSNFTNADVSADIILDNIVDLQFRYWKTNTPTTSTSSADSFNYWNSATNAPPISIPNWYTNGLTLSAADSAMTKRAPAGVEVIVTLVDTRTADLLRSMPNATSGVISNIINQKGKTFTTFIPIRINSL